MIVSTTKELESLLDSDQTALRKFKEGQISPSDLADIQRANLNMVRDYINTHGYPFKDIVSTKAYKGVFLTVLHADDLILMKKVIDIFSTSNEDQIERRDLAFLIDKFMVLQNLPQLYGTQYKKDSEGNISFLPIEEEELIDTRRKGLKMETFAEYRKQAAGL